MAKETAADWCRGLSECLTKWSGEDWMKDPARAKVIASRAKELSVKLDKAGTLDSGLWSSLYMLGESIGRMRMVEFDERMDLALSISKKNADRARKKRRLTADEQRKCFKFIAERPKGVSVAARCD